MNPDFLDRHSRRDSPLHRCSAGAKLAGALTLVGLTVALPPQTWPWIGAVLVVAIAISRVPVRYLVVRLLWLELVVAGMAVLALFQPGGLAVFGKIVGRSSLCLVTMLLLANTTPFAEILRVLRQLRVPGIFLSTLALMYRYLFVLADEAERMHRARQARTFRRQAKWPVLATVVGQLFVRSTERAERIYAAMCARGWR